MRSFRYGEKGFTLVELVIVFALLGILASLVIPNVIPFLTSGKVGAGRAERATLQVAVDGMMTQAGATELAAEVTDWDGNAADTVKVSVNGVDYDAVNYLRRTVSANSLWKVKTDGEVECTQYDGSTDADFLARINVY